MRTKLLILVKAYPEISTKYGETVCTAGITEDGAMMRLYPIKYRKLPAHEQYEKFEWVELDVEKRIPEQDFRPESYRPANIDALGLTRLSSIPTTDNWAVRKDYVLKNVHTNMISLIAEAYDDDKHTSLVVFKPTEIVKFAHPAARHDTLTPKQLAAAQQANMFEVSTPGKPFDPLPFDFSYTFRDDEGKESTMRILDWETGALYRNCLRNASGDTSVACMKVKEMYFDYFLTRDPYFILGTTLQWHKKKGPNPFSIIGVFYPPKDDRGRLF